jgi:quercetin dioxygenase-like cupin family protein
MNRQHGKEEQLVKTVPSMAKALLLLLPLLVLAGHGADQPQGIQKIGKDDLKQGPSTPGIVRHIAFQQDGVTVALAETESGLASGWHNHTGHDVYGYVVSGTVRFESGGKMITVEPGEFFHVPPHTVHREFNPSTDKGKVVLFITGTGPLVENVSGPGSAR